MNYYLQVFGEPRFDGDEPWGLRFEGHHLSMQAATVGCHLFRATPAFWGASPRTEPLAPMIDSSTALWAGLAPEQRARAQVNFGIEGQDARPGSVRPQPALGLPAEEMDADQRVLLRAVLAAYLDNMSVPIAADRFAAIEAAGIDAIHFAYRNGDFRISGPTFLIDFVYHEGSRTHIHSSWRDYAGDFGDDLIARHMAAEHGDDDPEMGPPDPPPAPGDCPADCVDGAGACCGACLAANGVCYAESNMWCDTFNYRWCGD